MNEEVDQGVVYCVVTTNAHEKQLSQKTINAKRFIQKAMQKGVQYAANAVIQAVACKNTQPN